jgi:cytochrome c biogenesis protein CcmG/thiol:disulfide interchange protein DsbE
LRHRALFLLFAVLAACNREQHPKSAVKTTTIRAAESPAARAEVGDVMPAYSTTYLDGKTFDIAAEKGNVVLLNVWATWCGPCRYETPELQALHEKYGQRGLKVIGVSIDEGGLDGVKSFVNENKITYPIALDAEGRVANVLRTTVLPTSVMIGRDGRIVWRKVGAIMPNETAGLDTLVERTLAKV